MKTKTILFLVFLFSCVQLFAQKDEYDPFEGNYELLKTCELVLCFDDTASNSVIFMDNNEKDSILKSQENPVSIPKEALLKDVIAADFDGDELDEIVVCYYNTAASDTSIELYYYDKNKSSGSITGKLLFSLPHTYEYGPIRVEKGNFDDDKNHELVLAFVKNEKIEFRIFNINDSEAEEFIDLVSDTLKHELASSARFDIICNDFTGNNHDEIILVKSTSLLRENIGSYRITMGFKIGIYTVSGSNLTLNDSYNLEYVNKFSGDLDHTKSAYLEGLHITKGDFENNGINEIAIGFIYKADLQRDPGTFYYEYRSQYFWTVAKPLRINPDLTIEEGEFYNINEWHHSKRTVDGTVNSYGKSTLGTSAVTCADLNNQGGEELIFANTKYIMIVEIDTNLSLNVLSTTDNFSVFGTNSHQPLRVASLYFDTTSICIKPHIITYRFESDPYNVIATQTMPFPQSNAHLCIYEPVLGESGEVESIEMIQEYELTSTESLSYLENNLLEVPDFDGGFLLGSPNKIIKNIIQPTIIINAPPTHFDIINGETYDVNYLTSSEVNPEFYTRFITTISSENVVSTDLNRSWGVSAAASAGGSIGLYKVKATVKASYGQDFAESNTTTNSISVTQESTASTDDKILGLKSEYHIYEYPVYVEGEKLGNMLSSIPVYEAPVWKESKNSELVDFVYSHEPQNIMSYPYYDDLSSNPNILSEFNTFIQNTGFSISNSSDESWTLEYATISSEIIEKQASFGLSVGVKASGTGWSAAVTGNYNQSNLSSHSTTIGEGFMINVNFDKLDDSFGETGYTLYPYLYWSKCGALVLDFKVDINPYNSWWSEKYGQYPDPAFILPWRLDPEKNHTLTNESKRMLTRDIRVYPTNPQTGDTITITAMVRNFSLADNLETQIKFYHGDPRNGGKLITDINEESHKTIANIASRKIQTISFQWICPEDLYEMPWIFAVIDPDNLVEEIHENNNIGFAALSNELPQYIPVTTEKQEIKNTIKTNIFPVPASSEITITFSLVERTHVIIDFYNELGQKVETCFKGNLQEGHHSIQTETGKLPDGIYFCKTIAGNTESIKKFLIRK